MQIISCAGPPMVKKKQGVYHKTLLTMRLTGLLIIFFCFNVTASVLAQRITLSVKNAPLENVLNEIKKQSGYSFFYQDHLLDNTPKITLALTNAPLKEAIEKSLGNQSLTYEFIGKTIVIKRKKEKLQKISNTLNTDTTIRGFVVDVQNIALAGATVTLKGAARNVVTDSNGAFVLNKTPINSTLVISYVGYQTREINVGALILEPHIKLEISSSPLNEVVVIPYGTTTQRLNTGSIVKISAKEIEAQPVMNPLAALEGRVAGMSVTQNTGLPGGNFSINIRGRTSINNSISNDPLFIIDGVPFANNNTGIGSLAGAYAATGGLSPFNTINPSDIESIEILKDADATSIYGSRGANGVVLITTKKGKKGTTTTNANIYSGFNSLTKTMDMMDTKQYLSMRKEALSNDGVTADQNNAYDLVLWDTTRNTDWKKNLLQNSAHTLDANVSVSGGSNNTQFLVGGGYHRETTVFPGDLADGRASAHFSITHQSVDGKFKLNFSGGYGGDVNHITASDLTGSALILSPNTINLVNASGKLNWDDNGIIIDNPLSYLYQKYTAKTDNYLSNLSLSYEIAKGLYLKNNFGFNAIYMSEISTYPIAAQNPDYAPVGYASFSNSTYKSLITEPQLEYIKKVGIGKIDALIGGTWQQNTSYNSTISGSGYTSDLLLESLGAANNIDDKSSTNTDYKYAAIFGRINYNIGDKYLVNITGRRDGSSRFGPQNRYANFGALGASWIFSQEHWIKDKLTPLSFGKLRLSYGTTGNDKIGDYNYLDTWTALTKTYLGQSGLNPTRLFNPDYRWEINKKLEVGMDLGFLNDRILFTANWYLNKSSNQLIPYTLPTQTGGSSIIANFPATVQNTGFEFLFNSVNFRGNHFTWNSTFNLSIPRNKLLSFPNLALSSYSSTLVVGKSINVQSGLLVKDVNPVTGVYEFIAKDGSITSSPTSADQRPGLIDLSPKFFGGFGNDFRYNGFQLNIFFEFKKQTGKNYIGNIISSGLSPGMPFNMPVAVNNRWTPDNTITDIQKFTQATDSPASLAAKSMLLYGADIMYSDASYIRLKTLGFSYSLPLSLVSKLDLKTLRIYTNAQNLFTITDYKGGDPETQNIYRLPPLKTLSFGLQATL